MKRIAALFILAATALSVKAGERANAVRFRFGGRIDAVTFLDTYASRTRNGGLLYLFPEAPAYNRYGEGINRQGSWRFGIGSSRLSVDATMDNVLGGHARAFVETDFLGSGDILGVLRLRHAFMSLDWERDQLLVGQTDNALVPIEITPNTVSYGAGEPINPLSRIVQVRYTRRFSPVVSASLSAGMLATNQMSAQNESMTPDLGLRLLAGWKSGSMVGVSAGFRSVRPRSLTDDERITYKRLSTFAVSAFGCYAFGGGHTVKLWGMWGQDPSHIALFGGYAPRLADIEAGNPDYGYAPLRTVSAWFDFETRAMNGWQPGIFAGWIKNLGTAEDILLENHSIQYYGIDWHYRIAPRLFYHVQRFSFGLEYMYSVASWGEEFNARYRPTQRYGNTHDHRVTLMARFAF